MLNIVGISAWYHDSACCLLQDGRLIAAAQEERFTRIKHDAALPFRSFMYCLQEGGLDITDIDFIAYYEDPDKKLTRQLANREVNTDEQAFSKKHDRAAIRKRIADGLGYEGEILFIDHHLSHAASAFYFSGFAESAILTVDGVGEWATTTYGIGNERGIELIGEVHFPHSIGLLYSTITSYLGFEVNEGEYKVMGLAPYGKPVFLDQLRLLITDEKDGNYQLNMEFFDFRRTDRMYSDKMIGLLGIAPRKRGTELGQVYKDLARSLQETLEEILMSKVRYLHKRTSMENLCMAGGVALNCVANGKIAREGPFRNIFVQPAANDSGGALGAAAQAFRLLTNSTPALGPIRDVYWGPGYSTAAVRQLLEATQLKFSDYQGDPKRMADTVSKELAKGKVIGWFQGRMEFGPRALGARSILADPRDAGMRDKVNFMVKKREGFRPFAPIVLARRAADLFSLDHPSPFMLETCNVISDIGLPAITHVDNSARVQTVDRTINARLTELLEAWDLLTGCPALLNTSFNVKDEPIVCDPADAIKCFVLCDLDGLVIDDFYIDRSQNSLEVLQFILQTLEVVKPGINHNIYSFL